MSRLGIFDIVGPIMIGPSSSHTAGSARIGFACSRLIKGTVKSVRFDLHGSFAKTYKGHGTDRALLAGVMGIREDSEDLRRAFEIAEERGISYHYQEADLGDVHPNTVRIFVTETDGRTIELTGSSIGGGNIRIISINGVPLTISGENPAVIAKHTGGKGIISGIANFMHYHDYDVKYMSFFKKSDTSDSDVDEGIVVIEVDKPFQESLIPKFEELVHGIVETYVIQ